MPGARYGSDDCSGERLSTARSARAKSMTEPEYAISSPDDMDHTVHDVFDGFGVGEVNQRNLGTPQILCIGAL